MRERVRGTRPALSSLDNQLDLERAAKKMTQPTQDISTFENDAQLENTHANMVRAGVPVETSQILDTWSYSTVEQHVIPNSGGQYIEFKKMTEADKTEFQAKTNRDVRVQSTTKDIKLNMDPGKERRVLLDICVVGWNLYRPSMRPQDNGALVQVAFDKKAFSEWLKVVDPKIIQDLEKAIRDANPWMRQDLTADEYDIEIAALEELRDEARKRELEK